MTKRPWSRFRIKKGHAQSPTKMLGQSPASLVKLKSRVKKLLRGRLVRRG